MQRLGLVLGSAKSIRTGLVLSGQNYGSSSSFISAPILNSIQIRTMAAKADKGALKKQKYTGAGKVKVAKPHFRSGTRLKRVDWLDTPRKPYKKPSKTKNRKVYGLNTDKGLTKYINRLKESPKAPGDKWVQALAQQVRISPENAATLTDAVLKNPKVKLEKLQKTTYIRLLDLWYRRKDVARSTEVFEAMKSNGKSTDLGYSIYAKTLATRGELAKAKEVLAEREAIPNLKGQNTLKVMINYVAADNFQEGAKLMEKYKSFRPPQRDLSSVIIGWALKHEEAEAAELYFQEAKEKFLTQTYSPPKTEEEYTQRVEDYNKQLQTRHEIMSKWGKELRKAVHQKRDSDEDELTTLKEVNKLAVQEHKLPTLPKLPIYPHRLTVDEFLTKFPVTMTPHILRPLIDMQQTNIEIPTKWVQRIRAGLSWKGAASDIKGLAHKIYLKDVPRYEHLKAVLTKLGLPAEELTYIPKPKQKVEPPKKKEAEIKKWWKKGRTQFDKPIA